MGMILTLYLISANVYNAVEAPSTRGFSYIEVWILGTQAPILLALFEYGFILLLKKIAKEKTNEENQQVEQRDSVPDLDDKIKKLDFSTMIISLISISTFISIYWIFLSM